MTGGNILQGGSGTTVYAKKEVWVRRSQKSRRGDCARGLKKEMPRIGKGRHRQLNLKKKALGKKTV